MDETTPTTEINEDIDINETKMDSESNVESETRDRELENNNEDEKTPEAEEVEPKIEDEKAPKEIIDGILEKYGGHREDWKEIYGENIGKFDGENFREPDGSLTIDKIINSTETQEKKELLLASLDKQKEHFLNKPGEPLYAPERPLSNGLEITGITLDNEGNMILKVFSNREEKQKEEEVPDHINTGEIEPTAEAGLGAETSVGASVEEDIEAKAETNIEAGIEQEAQGEEAVVEATLATPIETLLDTPLVETKATVSTVLETRAEASPLIETQATTIKVETRQAAQPETQQDREVVVEAATKESDPIRDREGSQGPSVSNETKEVIDVASEESEVIEGSEKILEEKSKTAPSEKSETSATLEDRVRELLKDEEADEQQEVEKPAENNEETTEAETSEEIEEVIIEIPEDETVEELIEPEDYSERERPVVSEAEPEKAVANNKEEDIETEAEVEASVETEPAQTETIIETALPEIKETQEKTGAQEEQVDEITEEEIIIPSPEINTETIQEVAEEPEVLVELDDEIIIDTQEIKSVDSQEEEIFAASGNSENVEASVPAYLETRDIPEISEVRDETMQEAERGLQQQEILNIQENTAKEKAPAIEIPSVETIATVTTVVETRAVTRPEVEERIEIKTADATQVAKVGITTDKKSGVELNKIVQDVDRDIRSSKSETIKAEPLTSNDILLRFLGIDSKSLQKESRDKTEASERLNTKRVRRSEDDNSEDKKSDNNSNNLTSGYQPSLNGITLRKAA
jgi:hypothetical protein